jgi:ABC-type multidrug transport system ATPase subunit
LTEWLDHPVGKLSHGIRQRTSLARAIATRPRVLLLDEPEGGLDTRARELWLRFLRTTLDQRQMLLVYAAHRVDGIEVPAEQIALTGSTHVES